MSELNAELPTGVAMLVLVLLMCTQLFVGRFQCLCKFIRSQSVVCLVGC